MGQYNGKIVDAYMFQKNIFSNVVTNLCEECLICCKYKHKI